MQKLWSAAFATALLVTGVAQAQDVVTNGSFETHDWNGVSWPNQPSYGGWTFPLGCTFEFNPNNAHSGSYSLAIRDACAGSVTQTLATIPGHVYALSYFELGTAAASSYPAEWQLFLGATPAVVAQIPNSIGWPGFTGLYTATAPTTTLAIHLNGDTQFSVIDDVSLVDTTPEPSTLAMLGTGLVAFVPLARRRQRRRSAR